MRYYIWYMIYIYIPTYIIYIYDTCIIYAVYIFTCLTKELMKKKEDGSARCNRWVRYHAGFERAAGDNNMTCYGGTFIELLEICVPIWASSLFRTYWPWANSNWTIPTFQAVKLFAMLEETIPVTSLERNVASSSIVSWIFSALVFVANNWQTLVYYKSM